MLQKTKGIVLNYIQYRETSIIAKIYTEHFGMQSYIVNGVRSKNARFKIALFQPLTCLDMVIYYKPGRNINRISEIQCLFPYRTIPYQQKKICIAFFLGEVLSKTIHEGMPDKNMFHFIESSIKNLDNCISSFENFHLWFMFRLSAHMGFKPENAEQLYHDALMNATQHECKLLSQLMTDTYPVNVYMSNDDRRKILEALIRFYKWHAHGMSEIYSAEILKDVLS